jgi:hypothetical protein
MHPVKLSRLALSILFMIVVIIFLTLLTSCSKYTLPIAEQQVTKAYLTYKPMVADKTRGWFPCIVTKNDTIIGYKDSLIYIDCPDVSTSTPADYLGSDTVYLNKTVTQNKFVKVPVYLPVKTVTVVQKIEDSAKIFQLNDALMQSVNETAKANETIEKLEAKVAKKNKWLLWGLIIIIALAGLNYLQAKRV